MKQNVRTTERMAVVVFLILLLMVVYQNCGVPVHVPASSTVKKLSEADITSLQAMDPNEKRVVCETASFYTCTHEVYSPNELDNGGTIYTRCLDVEDVHDHFCVMVNFSTVNTTGESRETVNCYNHLIGSGDAFPVRVETSTLEAAIPSVVALCKQTLKY